MAGKVAEIFEASDSSYRSIAVDVVVIGFVVRSLRKVNSAESPAGWIYLASVGDEAATEFSSDDAVEDPRVLVGAEAGTEFGDEGEPMTSASVIDVTGSSSCRVGASVTNWSSACEVMSRLWVG